MSEATHWAVGDVDMTHNDEDSAIEAFLDGREAPLPETITVEGYRPVDLTIARADDLVEGAVESVLERLNDEYGWEELNNDWKPTEKIKTAMKGLALAISEDYPVRLMEPVEGSSYEIDVRKWVGDESPEWLTENPDLFKGETT